MKQHLIRLFPLLLLMMLVTACAQEKTRQRVFWPPPPDRPRLEWIQNYYSQDDFPKTKSQETMESLLGKPELTFFARPFGIAADSDRGLVYISDPDARLVRYYDLRNYQIHLLSETMNFGRPLGMALDKEGNLYICDGQQAVVHVYGPDHRPRTDIGGQNHLKNPAFVAVNDRLNRVYVADGVASKIVVFARDGAKLFEWGEFGGEQGQFRSPQGMAIDHEDRIFVADQLNARIQVFDADGKFLYLFGERVDLPGGFEAPKDLAYDSEGNLHIVDQRKAALVSYSADGKLLLLTGGKGTSSPVGFSTPTSITIDKDDRIYIADSFNRRFGIWQYLSDAYLEKHPVK